MKNGLLILLSVFFLTGCSTSDRSEEIAGLSKEALTGSWAATKLTIVTNEGNLDLNIGQEYCETVDSSTLSFFGECSGVDIELCRTTEEFSINFLEIGLYDRTEVFSYTRAGVDDNNDCEITYYNNDSFNGFYKGSWELVGDEQILLGETYELINLISRGEEREVENFDESEITWRIIEFSNLELKIFWRTPDQIDYEITFVKN